MKAARSVGSKLACDAAGFDARKIEQRIDQPQQPQSVAMGDRHLARAARRQAARRSLQRVLERPQHQGQRRAEFVADIGEERGLGAIDFGQRFGAAALLLIGLGVGDRRGDLAGDQV